VLKVLVDKHPMVQQHYLLLQPEDRRGKGPKGGWKIVIGGGEHRFAFPEVSVPDTPYKTGEIREEQS